MAVNYQTVNYYKGTAELAVGASAVNTVVVPRIDLSGPDSLNFRMRLVASAAVEVTGISWKLQQSWDNATSWEDVNPGAAGATVTTNSVGEVDTDVTSVSDQVASTAHPFETCDEVYYKASAGNVITGLTDATKYYIIYVDANTFQVALTKELALAGTAIDLTQPAGGDTHYFTATSSELILNIENSTDEAFMPLLPVVRVVASTGTSDVYTVDAVYHARRV